jgi:anti-sigma B factor antagonist
LEIAQREVNGVYVLTLKGRLVLGDESTGFRSTVENLLKTGVTKMVINLEGVNYVDSAGLGSIIEAHRTTKARGGHLKLSNLGPKFRQALEMVRLLNLFESFPTESAALQSFQSGAAESA